MKTFPFASFALALACVFAAVLAPRLATPARAQMTPDTMETFRPALVDGFASSFSYSGKSAFKHGVTPGEASVWHVNASTNGRRRLAPTTFLTYGLAFSMSTIEADDTVPVPGRLGDISASLGLTRIISRQWSVSGFARPGYYGDMAHCTARALNMPVFAIASYARSKNLQYFMGLGVNPFGQYPVMPFAAARWVFSEGWTLNLGFPRLGVTWQVAKPLELGVHFTGQGGGYRTTQAPRNTARDDLAGTYISYRELRAGSRATWKFSKKTSLALEGGWMLVRRFNYYKRDCDLRGRPSAYVTLALDVALRGRSPAEMR